ncbi:MAG: hypothetical protein ACPLRY_06170 [Candidatus Bathyarchaeales archaeon]
MEKFLYLKLGFGNCLAKYWLNREENVKNVFNKHVAAIYFHAIKAEEYRKLLDEKDEKTRNEEYRKLLCKKHGRKEMPKSDRVIAFRLDQIKEFFEAGTQRTMFVTITHDKVYIYEPEGDVRDMDDKKILREYDTHLDELSKRYPKKRFISDVKTDDGRRHIPKIMYVKNVKEYDIKYVPHVLATLQCNQYLTRGTCRKIDPKRNWGAVQAIKHVLGESVKEPENAKELLSLLSWHELETLVFLILKNAGVHPSAWRGGTLPNIDIIATNYEEEEVSVGEIVFGAEDKKTFQIKRGGMKNGDADYIVNIDFEGKNDKVLNADWLLQRIKEEKQKDTKEWLCNSLKWVPDIESIIDKLQ